MFRLTNGYSDATLWITPCPLSPPSDSAGLSLGLRDEGGVGVMTLPRSRVPTPGSNLSLVSLGLLISSLREMQTMVKSAPGCWFINSSQYLRFTKGEGLTA